MGPSGSEHPDRSLILLVLEQLGPFRVAGLQAEPGAGRLAGLLASGSHHRVMLPASTARNGIAASLATGVTPHLHGLVGSRDPDPMSEEVRTIDARSWKSRPVWSHAARCGRRAVVLGWPAMEPVDAWAAASEPADEGLLLAGPGAFNSRQDPDDAWLLPPHSVHPESARPLIRAHRVHASGKETGLEATAYGHSIMRTAEAVLDDRAPDLMALWLPLIFRKGQPEPVDAAPLEHLLERLEGHPLALLCLPSLPRSSAGPQVDPVGRLVLHGCAPSTPLPPVLFDTDLASVVTDQLGLAPDPDPRFEEAPERFLEQANQRARLFTAAGFKPVRTMARKRVFARTCADRDVALGLDLIQRGDLEMAMQFFGKVLQSGYSEVAAISLARCLLMTGSSERLARLSSSLPAGNAHKDVLSAAVALDLGEPHRTVELLVNHRPTSPITAAFVVELLLRADEPGIACDLLRAGGRRMILSGTVRDQRIAMICARRAGRAGLRSFLAGVLLRQHPRARRLRRFLSKD
jgi:hypothetical protein